VLKPLVHNHSNSKMNLKYAGHSNSKMNLKYAGHGLHRKNKSYVEFIKVTQADPAAAAASCSRQLLQWVRGGA
jgi:hypothetical protein